MTGTRPLPPVELHPLPFGGRPFWIRPGTSDAQVLWDALAIAQHRPPPGCTPRLIWDVGANIGATVVDMATLFPAARIVALEPSRENVAVARLNLAGLPQCELIEAAAWTHTGFVSFTTPAGRESGGSIKDTGPLVAATSLADLLSRTGPPDYVKLDVEGAERALERETGWAAGVASIQIERHGSYTPEQCASDLAALGFRPDILPAGLA
jgi:FkbM family methyltransferase